MNFLAAILKTIALRILPGEFIEHRVPTDFRSHLPAGPRFPARFSG